MSTVNDLGETAAPSRKRQSARPRRALTALASRLRTLREQAKLPAVDVAVAVGIARSTLSSWEGGHDIPSREGLKALAQYYQVSLDWLATGAGSQAAPKAAAETEDEALLLFGFRQMPKEEAQHLLAMILSRVKGRAS